MSSLLGSETARQIDEAAFYVAAGGALATATYTAAAATGAPGLGWTGAELALVGAAVSWWTRRWPPARALLFGSLLGMLAGALWFLRIEQNLGVTNDEPGLILALRMTLPLVLASYLLVKAELAAFALVPGVTVFGLAAGQGDESVARAGFAVFLPLGLVAVGYAMLSTGEAVGSGHRLPDSAARLRGPTSWRARHWMTLGGSIAVIMILAQLIYLPVASWAAAHRWQIISGIAAPGTTRAVVTDPETEATHYAIGRGPTKLRPIPMLWFTGEYAPYWRGAVYDKYLGTAWGRSEAGSPETELESFPPDGTLTLPVPGGGAPDHLPTYDVEAKAELPFVFYAPGQAVHIVARDPQSVPASSHVIVNGYGIAEISGGTMHQGTRYAVTVLPLEPSRTRTAPPATSLSGRYLKVPLEANRVAELSQEIAGDEPSPERKLAALTEHLQRNCLYRTDAPAVPPGYDAVDYFIFDQKVGYCDLFASALAVMGRAVGIPTRLVTGYAFPSPVNAASREQQGFLLRESDGHAWVEAYLPASGGWVTVDGTPAGQESPTGPGWMKAALLRFRLVWRNRPSAVVAWALAVVLLLAAAVFLAARVRQRRPTGARPMEPDWRQLVTDLYLRLCQILRGRGYPREATETPFEYLAALETRWGSRDEHYGAAVPSLRALTQTFVLARYSLSPVTEEVARSATACLAEVQRMMQPRRRQPVDLRKL